MHLLGQLVPAAKLGSRLQFRGGAAIVLRAEVIRYGVERSVSQVS